MLNRRRFMAACGAMAAWLTPRKTKAEPGDFVVLDSLTAESLQVLPEDSWATNENEIKFIRYQRHRPPAETMRQIGSTPRTFGTIEIVDGEPQVEWHWYRPESVAVQEHYCNGFVYRIEHTWRRV